MRNTWNKIKNQYLSYFIVYVAKGLIRLLLKTCRIEVEGLEQFTNLVEHERGILMLWHNRLLILPEILRSKTPAHLIYRAFISQSRDGELLAILANSYQAGRTLRVSHNARHQALGKMIAQLKKGGEVMVITPDGPRGPRYQVKPGIVVAAKETAAYIIPLTWAANSFWQLKTWDKMILPKPFSCILVKFGESINIPKDSKKNLKEETILLQEVLKKLDTQAYSSILSNKDKWPK